MRPKFFGPGFSCSQCDSTLVSSYSLWDEDGREEEFGLYYIIKLKSSAQFKKKHLYL